MFWDLRYGIGLFLPTALLISPCHLLPREKVGTYRELFASSSYYLDVHYPAFKRRESLAPGQSIAVSGYFATHAREHRIQGTVVPSPAGWKIVFEFAGGKFTGEWRINFRRCEPEVHFQIVRFPTPRIERGVLKGAFCEKQAPYPL